MQKQLIETANTASQHTGYTVALARSEEEEMRWAMANPSTTLRHH